jgi:hypothetical protein
MGQGQSHSSRDQPAFSILIYARLAESRLGSERLSKGRARLGRIVTAGVGIDEGGIAECRLFGLALPKVTEFRMRGDEDVAGQRFR